MKIHLDSQLEKFIASLEKPAIARVLRTVDLLETFGNNLAMPHSKKVLGKLFELRIRGKQEIRIFYAFLNGAAYLLHGFIKKQQKTPRREIEQAILKFNSLTKYNI